MGEPAEDAEQMAENVVAEDELLPVTTFADEANETVAALPADEATASPSADFAADTTADVSPNSTPNDPSERDSVLTTERMELPEFAEADVPVEPPAAPAEVNPIAIPDDHHEDSLATETVVPSEFAQADAPEEVPSITEQLPTEVVSQTELDEVDVPVESRLPTEQLATETVTPSEFAQTDIPAEVEASTESLSPEAVAQTEFDRVDVPSESLDSNQAELSLATDLSPEASPILDSATDETAVAESLEIPEHQSAQNDALEMPDDRPTDVESLPTETPASSEFAEVDVPAGPHGESESSAPLTGDQPANTQSLDLPDPPPVDAPTALGVSADVADDRGDLQVANETGTQDESRLEIPGEVAESNVPLATADRPMESDEATLPVSDAGFYEGPNLPLPNDPIRDAGWTAELPSEPPPYRESGSGNGDEFRQRDPFELPPGVLDGFAEQLEPQFDQLRSAVQGRTADLIEEQSILSALNSIPE